jgi:glycosyltransferase involved in cell wall biosynthesis
MKISYITAGAGRMYCGSCLRDNALAKSLMDAGHDVVLIPTYTPTRTDETNVSFHRVFLGGINIFLQQRYDIFRRSPQFMDRLLDFRPLLKALTHLGISVDPADLGKLTIAMLRGADGALRKEVLRLVRFLSDEIAPEIINLPNSLLIALAPAIKSAMKVPVCCTLQGEDLFLQGLREPYRSEAIRIIREHASSVDAFIAVSRFGATSMADFLGIEKDRIHVVPLGISFDGFRTRSGDEPAPFTIGYLARITPEKGLRFLCEAYRIFRTRGNSGELHAAGYLAPEQKSYLAGIREDIHSWGLSQDFHYHGEIDRRAKVDFLHGLSVFSVPEYYAEPKGLFLIEAMAAGIPVVQPRRGAFTEIVERTGGGVLVEPDNPEQLADAFGELAGHPERRWELGRRGFEGVRAHYSVAQMAEKALAVYRSLLDPKVIAAVL